MIYSKRVNVKWNSKNKKYFVDKGYVFTKMGEELSIRIEDLKKSSHEEIEIQCDYCGDIFLKKYSYYNRNKKRNNNIEKDACRNCVGKKTSESNMKKYGVYSIRQLDVIQEKIKDTNKKKYGVENVMFNKEVKSKMKEYFINKYGVENPFQLEDVKNKIKDFYEQNPDILKEMNSKRSETYKKNIRKGLYNIKTGKDHWNWQGGISDENHTLRTSTDYQNWRTKVFQRDEYTCQKCSQHGYKLNSHHIFDWKNYKYLRFEVNNGITLCDKCHRDFHKKYSSPNSLEQIIEFINK